MLSHINVGTGVDCTIRELAQTIAQGGGLQRTRGSDATQTGRHRRASCWT